jgi:hypothetical protein
MQIVLFFDERDIIDEYFKPCIYKGLITDCLVSTHGRAIRRILNLPSDLSTKHFLGNCKSRIKREMKS